MNSFIFDSRQAAEMLESGLRALRRAQKQERKYHYDLPSRLIEERERAAMEVRDAVRFLCSPEADD